MAGKNKTNKHAMNTLLSIKYIRAKLQFAREHKGQTPGFVKDYALDRHVWQRPNTAFQKKNIIPTMMEVLYRGAAPVP